MLQVSVIRENKDEIIERLKVRNQDFSKTIDDIIKIDEKRRSTQQEMDDALMESNRMSKDIGNLYQQGKVQEANTLKEHTSNLKAKVNELKSSFSTLEDELKALLFLVPNVPHKSVPEGKSDQDNVVIFEHGIVPTLAPNALPHWELASKFDLIDFDLGSKITGAGFPVYKGKGARMQRALINYFLDQADDAGYKEMMMPLLVNEDSGIGTGQLPDKEGQMYHVQLDDLYLIPTAEVPITNIYRDVIIKKDEFPIKMCGYTPCFRREAGSYGKDVRGLNRLHQFDKVEIVQIQHPDKSYETLDEMVGHVKNLLVNLNLPFRIVRLCGGDLGFASVLTYDFEVYSAAQKRWLEVSSVSNFESFQSNRLKCRFKNDEGKTELVHTLNGSALALPRVLAALMENNQTEEGINVPEVLIPFVGTSVIN